MAHKPQPQDFEDYRAYLNALVDHTRSTSTFSFRKFAKRVGYRSPSYFKLVLDGQRNLSTDAMGRVANYFGLHGTAREMFETMVLHDQAPSSADRERYRVKLSRLVASVAKVSWSADRVDLTDEQLDVYRHWYTVLLHSTGQLPDFKADPEWLSRRLAPFVTAEQAERGLKLLESSGLMVRDADGELRTPNDVMTGPTTSAAVRPYHRVLAKVAAYSLDARPVSERNLTSVTTTMTRRQYTAVCERIAEFRREVLDIVDAIPDADDAKELYAIAFNVVPFSRPISDDP